MNKLGLKYILTVFNEFINMFNIFILKTKKKIFALLFIFSLIIIFLESYTLAIVYSASNSVLNESFNPENIFLSTVIDLLKIDGNNILFLSFIILLIFIFIKNILVIFLIFLKNNFFIKMHRNMSKKIFEKLISQNYDFFISKNTSEFIAHITNDLNIAMRGFEAIFNILIEFLLIVAILIYLTYIDFVVSLYFTIGSLIFFILYTLFTKKKILSLSNERLLLNHKIVQDLQQGFGNFREIIIYNCKKLFSDEINLKFKIFFSNLKITNILQQITRVVIEQVFIIFVVMMFIIINYFSTKSVIDILPLLAVYLFAFLKILPSLNKFTIEFQQYLFGKLFIKKIDQIFNLENEIAIQSTKKLNFEDKIEFNKVSFNFSNQNKKILDQISFKIKKNEKVGILGETGSGKSTLLNLIMGFLHPNNGNIFIDNSNLKNNFLTWQKLIGYVPQSIYILDDTLKKNITFQSDDKLIDFGLLEKSIENSGLIDFLKKQTNGYESILGERGSKISGGEILRIGLARAYYSKAKVFILDEFTSSLDIETENKLLDIINNIKKTFVIVSHKQNSLKYCDRILRLKNSKIVEE